MSTYQAVPIFNQIAEHGEGPLWVSETNTFYWVDLIKGFYYKADYATLKVEKFEIGQSLGVMALRKNGGLVMATQNGFGFFEESTKKFELINSSPETEDPEVRFNDGAVDAKGRFLAATMEWDGRVPVGRLYCLHENQSFYELDKGFLIPNGMGWNEDNTTFYLVDTFQHALFAYDYDLETGLVSNRRVFIQFAENEFPDGMAMDEDGGFWIAFWEGSKVVHFDADGKKVKEISVPVPYPTSCCFAGDDLQTLLVTSSKLPLNAQQLAEYPLSGSCFSIETDSKGKKMRRFAG